MYAVSEKRINIGHGALLSTRDCKTGFTENRSVFGVKFDFQILANRKPVRPASRPVCMINIGRGVLLSTPDMHDFYGFFCL
jgi:hypothetical protein